MKRSKKVTIGIIIFFIIVATIIGGRTAMGVYFKKKFGKRPPPGVIVEIVVQKKFSQTIESYCTALSSKTTSFKINKNDAELVWETLSVYLISENICKSLDAPAKNLPVSLPTLILPPVETIVPEASSVPVITAPPAVVSNFLELLW